MRDVIQKMLEAEAEAKRIVAGAEAEAERIRADARRQAHQLTDQARAETRTDTDRIAEEAAGRSDSQRRAAIADAAKTIDDGLHLDEPLRTRAVETVVRRVCGST